MVFIICRGSSLQPNKMMRTVLSLVNVCISIIHYLREGGTYYSIIHNYYSFGMFFFSPSLSLTAMAMVEVGKNLYVFGGNGGSCRFGRIHKLNPETMIWSNLDLQRAQRKEDGTSTTTTSTEEQGRTSSSGTDGVEQQPQTTGLIRRSSPPTPRSAHSWTSVKDRYIYLFGGWNGSNELCDLKRYDTGT